MSALALLFVLQAPEVEPWEGSLFASLTLVSGENPYPIGVATIARGAF